jgi:hypothetical protein
MKRDIVGLSWHQEVLDHSCLIFLVSSLDSLLKLARLDLHHLVSVLINVGCEVN